MCKCIHNWITSWWEADTEFRYYAVFYPVNLQGSGTVNQYTQIYPLRSSLGSSQSFPSMIKISANSIHHFRSCGSTNYNRMEIHVASEAHGLLQVHSPTFQIVPQELVLADLHILSKPSPSKPCGEGSLSGFSPSWMNLVNMYVGILFVMPLPSLTLVIDASALGRGAHLGSIKTPSKKDFFF